MDNKKQPDTHTDSPTPTPKPTIKQQDSKSSLSSSMNGVKWKNLSNKSQNNLLPPGAQSSTKANGTAGPKKPALKRTDSLNVPGSGSGGSTGGTGGGGGGGGAAGQKDGVDEGRESPNSPASRKSSVRSIESRVSAVDFSKLGNAQVNQANQEEEDDKKTEKQKDGMYIRSVIPYLPTSLAVFCLLLNVLIPGTGTMLSGFSIFCCGRPRVESKENHVTITCCTNVMVGMMQLFTVTFMLVGWFWALVWGIYMVILAVEHAHEEKEQREKELQAKALTALNANLRPWTLMRA